MLTKWLWSQINPLLSIRRTGAWQIHFKVLTNIWKPSQNELKCYKKKKKKFFPVILSSLLPSYFDGIKLVPCIACCTRLTNFRTSSPPTSCQRLGPCSSRSWWSWSLPALKIGRRSRARERKRSLIETFTNYQLIKDKIYLFRKDLNWAGWPWDDLADQGGAVVPDNGVATHEIDL